MIKIDKMIEVLQAFKAGKTVQMCGNDCIPNPKWVDIKSSTNGVNGYFDFEGNDYRVKAEPKTIWVSSDSRGLYATEDPSAHIAHSNPIKYIELTDDVRKQLNME